MLQLSPLEFFFRTLPESCIFIWAGYMFSNNKIGKTKFILSSILLSLCTFFIRLLPIHFGVHTILFLIVYILICTLINKIDIINSISSGLISIISLFICEGINVFILNEFLQIDIQIAFKEPITKILYGIPSLFLFGLIIGILYRIISKRRRLYKNVSN